MGDSENTFQPSKKRAAGVQLSRDNQDLATGKFARVCRRKTSTPASAAPASNPLSEIFLVPSASTSTSMVEVAPCSASSEENKLNDKNNSKSETGADDLKAESTAEAKPCESNDESKADFNSEKDETDIVGEQSLTTSAGGKVTEGENSGDGNKRATEDDSGGNEAEKDVEGKRDGNERATEDDSGGLDDNDETSEQEAGTFKRASDEVLATGKFVRVFQRKTSTPASVAPASNPFSAICLVPPASTSMVEVAPCSASSEENKLIDKDNSKSEKGADDLKGESTTEAKPCESNDESKAEFNSDKDDTEIVGKQSLTTSAGGKVTAGENSGDGNKRATEDDSGGNEAEKDVEGKRDGEEKGNGEVTVEKNAETASFSSFQQLSSCQNAFSGFSGTGFSASSFVFGSIPKNGLPIGSTTGSGFGISNNENSSIFGTLAADTISKTEADKFPSMQEVPIETGEENEMAVFTSNSVLFEYIDGSWKERGKGELRVNVSTTGTGTSRLIMRARGNYRLILNANLFPDMKLTNMDKKGITFACVNSAGEGKDGLSTIALKFKDATIVEDFRAAVMEHKTKTTDALKTPENSSEASDVEDCYPPENSDEEPRYPLENSSEASDEEARYPLENSDEEPRYPLENSSEASDEEARNPPENSSEASDEE